MFELSDDLPSKSRENLEFGVVSTCSCVSAIRREGEASNAESRLILRDILAVEAVYGVVNIETKCQ